MKRILLVDDHTGFLRILSTNLIFEGYDVITAPNGKEALQMIKDGSPDLVLLDIMMPVMNGFEMLSRLRECSNMPVIVNSSDVHSKKQALKLGADDFILKPFELRELLEKISGLIAGKELDTVSC